MQGSEWGLRKTCYYGFACAWTWFSQVKPVGTNVFDEEWDLLVVLDSCRTDLMREVSNEYDYIDHVGSIRSVGSITTEWMANTFHESYRSEVRGSAFLTASPHTKTVFDKGSYLTNEIPVRFPFPRASVVDREDFAVFDEVWRYHHDQELGAVPPRRVTDRAVATAREHDFDRMIVHYMQPHEPFIGADFLDVDVRVPVWEGLERGLLEPEVIWRAYRENLRFVLDDVSLLLENVDAHDVAITADHGNAFGEWGVFGHPIGFPHPSVRRVPWVETTAQDAGTHDPGPLSSEDESRDVDQLLRDLGYLE